jgi:hypothetical protein
MANIMLVVHLQFRVAHECRCQGAIDTVRCAWPRER